MAWFKVDDGLHDHRKVRAAGTPAMGLWVLAGSWSAANETHGFVPAAVVVRWATKAVARKLVDAGLWEPAQQDGETGWRFHDWREFQPTEEEIEAKRAEARERMRKIRANKAKGSRDVRANTPPNDVGTASEVRSTPARPGPYPNYLLTLISRLAAGDAREDRPPPAEVISSWQAIAGPDVDLEAEAAAYLARFGDRPARDERGAWLGWLRHAAGQHATDDPGPDDCGDPPPPRRQSCGDPDCADGWLPDDPDSRPVPCPTCRPHLRPIPTPEAS